LEDRRVSLFGGGSKSAAQTPTKALGIDFQSSQYGPPLTVLFGKNKVSGNVIWYGDFAATSHKSSQGGKGGGGGSTTSYTYAASFQLALCEGPASIVNVYNGSSTVSLSNAGGVAFSGTVGQAAWSHLSGTAALGYSGTALAAFQNLQLGSSASLPNYNFEMAGRNQFGGGIADANPADIVTAICTDTQVGIKFGALGDLSQFKAYCTAAGIFFSPDVTAVADLGRDDFITNGASDPVTIKRIGPADAMNIQRVEFNDRSNTYHTSGVVASIDQDVVGTGARADADDSVNMITTASVARQVAQNLLQRTYYIRNTYEFQLSWRYCYLEPMDVVTLTDANTGLYLTPVRLTEVSEDEHGLLSITAEEFPEGVSHASLYATQPNAGTNVDPNVDPGAIDSPYLMRGPGFLVSNACPEIWAAISATSPLWGGCDIFLSQDGTSYTYLATTTKRAAYGELTNALAIKADPDTTSAPNVVLNGPVQLLGGTATDADNFVTLSLVDSEVISYETATLASGPSYTLGYLRRGGYGSAIAAHSVGAPFVRLDDAIVRIPVDPSQIGATVYLKFRSFNVFGKGGRTLAEETAYTYVIGTNVELPDVPITPTGFAVLAVADGINLTWSNANPAAVGCTSIEYSTTGTGGWSVLAQVGPTATSYHHSFTSGATYYYRARSRGPLVSAGWSSYTATLSSAGVNVGAISTNATTAVGQVAQLPVINGGFDMAPTGYGWTPDSGTGWITDTGSHSPGVQPNCARHTGTSSPTTGAYRNNGLAACQPGQVYKTQALIKAVGANGACYVYISWCDASGAEIATTVGNGITGSTTAGSFAVGAAPAGTVFARTCLAYSGQTSGDYYVDNVLCSQYPSSLDEVPDSATYLKGLARTQGLVENGDFEVGASTLFPPPGWQLGTLVVGGSVVSPAYETGSPYAGSRSFEFGAAQYNGYESVRKYAVTPGDYYAVGGALFGPSGAALFGLYFLNASNASVGSVSIRSPSSGFGYSTAVGKVPATAVSAVLVIANFNTGSVGVEFDALFMARCTSYDNATAIAGSGTKAYVDFSDSTAGGHLNKNQDNIADTATYGRVSQTDLSSNRVGLRIAGSGQRIGDQRNLLTRTTANIPAKVPTVISYSYASSTTAPVNVTISVAAWTMLSGSVSVAYNAMSTSISLPAGTTNVFLYFDDASQAGGTQTLIATTNSNDVYGSDARVFVGGVAVTVTLNSGGTGGGGGGGGGGCVCVDQWLPGDVQAGDVQSGDLIHGTAGDLITQPYRVDAARINAQPCWQLVTESGASVSASDSTPMTLPDGSLAMFPDMLGELVAVRRHDASAAWERVTQMLYLGMRYVNQISIGGNCYWAGDINGIYVSTHNNGPLPK
jgi:hypothetical protein